METQYDGKKRVVSLENLKALCDQQSGTCHRFWVANVTPNRVSVWYSNPDEYANEWPFQAVYPCYVAGSAHKDNPLVILDILKTVGEPKNHNGEGWQCFAWLDDAPHLWRNPSTGKWETENVAVKQ